METREPIERIFASWAGLASHFIGECYDLAKPHLDSDYNGLSKKAQFVAGQLFTDCHLTSESVLILIHHFKAWDADLICRSVVEGSLKYVFMLKGTNSEIETKVNEYWDVLPSLALVRRSDRLKLFFETVSNPDGTEWQALREMLLDPSEAERLRSLIPKRERQRLEVKWSFSGITRHFVNSADAADRQLASSAHNYGMSSHLIHKDGDGIGMAWDRRNRDDRRRAAATLGHTSRIVSDVCSYAMLRLFTLLGVCGGDNHSITELQAEYRLLFDQLSKANAHFNEVEYGAPAPSGPVGKS
jgi:hypothetical protein